MAQTIFSKKRGERKFDLRENVHLSHFCYYDDSVVIENQLHAAIALHISEDRAWNDRIPIRRSNPPNLLIPLSRTPQ